MSAPLCLPCYRLTVDMQGDPPRVPAQDRRMEDCGSCGRPTNYGIYR